MNAALEVTSRQDRRHPHYDLTLSDAVAIAEGIASVRLQSPPSTFAEARILVKQALDRTSHVWITGTAALELLDAAIQAAEGA